MAGASEIRDVSISGTAHRIAGSLDETGTIALRALANGNTEMDFTFPSGQQFEKHSDTVNGPRGQWTGSDGKSLEMPQHNLMTDSAWFFPPMLLHRRLVNQEYLLESGSSETREGQQVEHVSASQQFGRSSPEVAKLMTHLSRIEIYLDSKTLLPSSVCFNIHPDHDAGRDIPVEIRYSDYRVVNGLQVPFHVQKYIRGALFLDLQLETVVVNTGLTINPIQ